MEVERHRRKPSKKHKEKKRRKMRLALWVNSSWLLLFFQWVIHTSIATSVNGTTILSIADYVKNSSNVVEWSSMDLIERSDYGLNESISVIVGGQCSLAKLDARNGDAMWMRSLNISDNVNCSSPCRTSRVRVIDPSLITSNNSSSSNGMMSVDMVALGSGECDSYGYLVFINDSSEIGQPSDDSSSDMMTQSFKLSVQPSDSSLDLKVILNDIMFFTDSNNNNNNNNNNNVSDDDVDIGNQRGIAIGLEIYDDIIHRMLYSFSADFESDELDMIDLKLLAAAEINSETIGDDGNFDRHLFAQRIISYTNHDENPSGEKSLMILNSGDSIGEVMWYETPNQFLTLSSQMNHSFTRIQLGCDQENCRVSDAIYNDNNSSKDGGITPELVFLSDWSYTDDFGDSHTGIQINRVNEFSLEGLSRTKILLDELEFSSLLFSSLQISPLLEDDGNLLLVLGYLRPTGARRTLFMSCPSDRCDQPSWLTVMVGVIPADRLKPTENSTVELLETMMFCGERGEITAVNITSLSSDSSLFEGLTCDSLFSIEDPTSFSDQYLTRLIQSPEVSTRVDSITAESEDGLVNRTVIPNPFQILLMSEDDTLDAFENECVQRTPTLSPTVPPSSVEETGSPTVSPTSNAQGSQTECRFKRMFPDGRSLSNPIDPYDQIVITMECVVPVSSDIQLSDDCDGGSPRMCYEFAIVDALSGSVLILSESTTLVSVIKTEETEQSSTLEVRLLIHSVKNLADGLCFDSSLGDLSILQPSRQYSITMVARSEPDSDNEVTSSLIAFFTSAVPSFEDGRCVSVDFQSGTAGNLTFLSDFFVRCENGTWMNIDDVVQWNVVRDSFKLSNNFQSELSSVIGTVPGRSLSPNETIVVVKNTNLDGEGNSVFGCHVFEQVWPDPSNVDTEDLNTNEERFTAAPYLTADEKDEILSSIISSNTANLTLDELESELRTVISLSDEVYSQRIEDFFNRYFQSRLSVFWSETRKMMNDTSLVSDPGTIQEVRVIGELFNQLIWQLESAMYDDFDASDFTNGQSTVNDIQLQAGEFAGYVTHVALTNCLIGERVDYLVINNDQQTKRVFGCCALSGTNYILRQCGDSLLDDISDNGESLSDYSVSLSNALVSGYQYDITVSVQSLDSFMNDNKQRKKQNPEPDFVSSMLTVNVYDKERSTQQTESQSGYGGDITQTQSDNDQRRRRRLQSLSNSETTECRLFEITMLSNMNTVFDTNAVIRDEEYNFPFCEYWNQSMDEWDDEGCVVSDHTRNSTMLVSNQLFSNNFKIAQYSFKLRLKNHLDMYEWRSLDSNNLTDHGWEALLLLCLTLAMFMALLFLFPEQPKILDSPMLSIANLYELEVLKERATRDFVGKEAAILNYFIRHLHDKGHSHNLENDDNNAEDDNFEIDFVCWSGTRKCCARHLGLGGFNLSLELWLRVYLKNRHSIFGICFRDSGSNINAFQRIFVLLLTILFIFMMLGWFYALGRTGFINDGIAALLISLLSVFPALFIRSMWRQVRPVQITWNARTKKTHIFRRKRRKNKANKQENDDGNNGNDGADDGNGSRHSSMVDDGDVENDDGDDYDYGDDGLSNHLSVHQKNSTLARITSTLELAQPGAQPGSALAEYNKAMGITPGATAEEQYELANMYHNRNEDNANDDDDDKDEEKRGDDGKSEEDEKKEDQNGNSDHRSSKSVGRRESKLRSLKPRALTNAKKVKVRMESLKRLAVSDYELKRQKYGELRESLMNKEYPFHPFSYQTGWIFVVILALVLCYLTLMFAVQFDLDWDAQSGNDGYGTHSFKASPECWNESEEYRIILNKRTLFSQRRNEMIRDNTANIAGNTDSDVTKWILNIFLTLTLSLLFWEPILLLWFSIVRVYHFSHQRTLDGGLLNTVICCCNVFCCAEHCCLDYCKFPMLEEILTNRMRRKLDAKEREQNTEEGNTGGMDVDQAAKQLREKMKRERGGLKALMHYNQRRLDKHLFLAAHSVFEDHGQLAEQMQQIEIDDDELSDGDSGAHFDAHNNNQNGLEMMPVINERNSIKNNNKRRKSQESNPVFLRSGDTQNDLGLGAGVGLDELEAMDSHYVTPGMPVADDHEHYADEDADGGHIHFLKDGPDIGVAKGEDQAGELSDGEFDVLLGALEDGDVGVTPGGPDQSGHVEDAPPIQGIGPGMDTSRFGEMSMTTKEDQYEHSVVGVHQSMIYSSIVGGPKVPPLHAGHSGGSSGLDSPRLKSGLPTTPKFGMAGSLGVTPGGPGGGGEMSVSQMSDNLPNVYDDFE